jgi:DNA-binding MurR/RpiR family transcriptional regulator
VKDVVDIVMRLKLRAEEGTKSDRRVAGVILADLDFASKGAIADIAARAAVSEPTVTRFCRSLGCEGVRDFKFRLAQALAVGGQYLSAEPLDRDARERRIAGAIGGGAIAALERVRDSVDMASVIDVAERLASARQVLVFGSGGTSSMLAVEMQNRLFRLGLPVVAHVDGQLQRMSAAVAGPGFVVLGFSTSGYAQSVIDATHVARQYGAGTVAVTQPGSALAAAAETVIGFTPVEDGNVYKPTSSRYGLLAIADMIATATAETIGPKVLEGLRRIKHSLNTLKVDDPRLPLGD